MIQFDAHTLKDWQTRGIMDISCFLIQKGCAGETVMIEEGISEKMDTVIVHTTGIRVHFKIHEQSFFDSARLTFVKNKWIVASDTIERHCGCGSSFSRNDSLKVSSLKGTLSDIKKHFQQKRTSNESR